MSFRGQIAEIPLGVDGLTGDKNLSQVTPGSLLVADNLTFRGGTLQKEGGATTLGTVSGTPAIMSGYDWDHDGSTQRTIVFTGTGQLLKDGPAGTFAATNVMVSGLTVTAATPAVFVECGLESAAATDAAHLAMFSHSNVVQIMDADPTSANTGDINTPPADWATSNQPTFGFVHDFRLWGGGNPNDPHRIYGSSNNDHEDFTGDQSRTLSIFPGEGERLIGGASYKGIMVLWKYPRGIYYVDTRDPTTWTINRVTLQAGLASPLAFDFVDDDIVFVTPDGNIQLLSLVRDAFSNVSNRALSDLRHMDEFIRDNVNFAQIKRTRVKYYPAARELHIALPGIGSTNNNLRLVLDLNDRDNPKWRASTRDTPVALWLRKDANSVPRLVHGDDGGIVYLMDQEDRGKAGGGYSGEFQTAHIDLSHIEPRFSTKRKEGRFLEMVVEPKGNWNLNVEVRWDGNSGSTYTFNMGTTGAALGSFVLGTNALAEEQVVSRKRRITGGGRRVSFVGSNNGVGQDFSIANMFLHYQLGDERITV